jgi:hypothetical protein
MSGSIESKLEELLVLDGGVSVDRDYVASTTNDLIWRVTFNDVSPEGANDFALQAGTNNLLTMSGAQASLSVTQLVDGSVYPVCTGSKVVPENYALSSGQEYFARVTAINDVGFSLPQVSSNSQVPMLTPGAPTSVTLRTQNSTALAVQFSPPADDGGDPVSSYLVEYTKSIGFSDPSQTLTRTLDNIVASAFYTVHIPNLQTGIDIYVRVSAANSQGYGSASSSTPTYLQPYEISGKPTDVNLAVTSSTMLTVSFDEPVNTGGDSIKEYIVEWDTASNFNFEKDSLTLDASLHRSVTLTNLLSVKTYFVRVIAVNNAGNSQPQLSSPQSASPSNREPGKPHSIVATTGNVQGEIDVSWQRPKIPWHTIPCGGLVTNPLECPSESGQSDPSSNGGMPIYEYTVSFNERADFAGFDSGEVVTTKTQHTIKNLIAGRTYYIRVLARNSMGTGQFCSFVDVNCNIPMNPVSAQAKA